MTALSRHLLPWAAALLLGGCALPLTHPGAGLDLPASWDEVAAAPPAQRSLEADWWRGFGAPELETLIARALAGSPDLALATERVVQAEIAVRSAGASLFPALDLQAATAAGRSRSVGESSAQRSSSAGLQLSYEIDLWGSNILRWQGSQASLAASRHDYEATRLVLIAGVARAYWQVLSLRERLAIARSNLALAERLFDIVEARYRHGAASALDLSRQRSTVLAVRDAVLPLQVQEGAARRALALLVGALPQGFELQGMSIAALQVPAPDAGLPGELLLRRPDIAAAEARLAALDADIEVARAALFPLKLSIGLSSGLSSERFGLLGLGDPVSSAALGVNLLQALFDGGRLRGQVQASESQRRQGVETWRKTVLTALKEVDDALAEAERSRRQTLTQEEIRREAARALRLSELRYKEGRDGLDTLLDAQRNLFSAEDAWVQQRFAHLAATVDVYKALGGGWRQAPADAQPQVEAARR